MPDKSAVSKFTEIELLRHGQPYAVIPKFFFRLWHAYPELPDSWWKTLFNILNVTLGGSAAGIEGTLAYSELPVDSHQFSMFKAALDGYQRLMKIETAGYESVAGSRFVLNPEATEDDWITFVDLLRIAWLSGVLKRRLGHGYEQVKVMFSKFAPHKPEPLSMPLWSEILRRAIADKPGDFDIWNDENWKRRGFDIRWMHKPGPSLELIVEFDDLTHGEWAVLLEMFHSAWVSTDELGGPPRLAAEPEALESYKHGYEDHEGTDDEPGGFHFAKILSKFRKGTDEEGEYLESDWLTARWHVAEADAEVKKVAAKVFQPTLEGISKAREQLLSRQPRRSKD